VQKEQKGVKEVTREWTAIRKGPAFKNQKVVSLSWLEVKKGKPMAVRHCIREDNNVQTKRVIRVREEIEKKEKVKAKTSEREPTTLKGGKAFCL